MDLYKRLTVIALGAMVIIAACGGGNQTTAPSRAPSGGATSSAAASSPTNEASDGPSEPASDEPSEQASDEPSQPASDEPSDSPSDAPSDSPSDAPTDGPSASADTSAPPMPTDIEGTVYVEGSSTVEPITLAVSEDLAATNPGFSYTVNGPGTGDGFDLFFCTGETDVNDASRTIDEEEVALCQENGVSYVELPIGFDGITVFTHPDTALECVTFEDLYALFGPESSEFTTWEDAQALAAELGSTTTFPTGPLAITAPGDESGTYSSFIELVTADVAEARFEEGVITEEEIEVLGTHYTPSPNDNVIVENVSGTPNSLGFAGFSFYDSNSDVLKALQIDAGDGCIAPSAETIADGSYPVSRLLYIYPSIEKMADNPALVPWVDFYLSDAGIANVTERGYVALPADQLAATRSTWESAKAGG